VWGVRSSDGERQGEFGHHVFLIPVFHLPSRPVDKGKISFSFLSSIFYKMILDDESDPFRGEVSLWRNYRDETFISTIHAILIIFGEYLLFLLAGADQTLLFQVTRCCSEYAS